ncbi:kinase-like protein [Piedraia hortae CBS 480.64]|uniref:Kinase-like protein n=1 Tax=Piedraia hortae CBS 480.64 TaxID=1314780 RepID=A0A6A7C9F3_9PEZI|nr:kinase-like protein [Piedraia hortae CBS 480.64]
MPWTQAEWEVQEQQAKLANSYQELLNEFASAELHSVGNYTLGRLVGKGSFGKVYLAAHKLTNGSRVVLKSARKDDGNLAREIHHHRQFLHPHIARLYEVIVTETLVWLVLEYCPGDELYNHLLQHGRIEPARVQKIFTQLVGAVSYVHSKRCVHRDLKLENILLDKHENVKLVDFGFTREYQGSTNHLQTWCGTICYAAPEMIRGEKYAGEKVDVWSLGVILYALLCGELPFDEDDDQATKARILKEEPNYPDHLPPQALTLIKELLSKRPLLRPSLADILKNPWLAEHAPQQQEILKLLQPPPFSTQIEQDTLQRMKSAGVDIDMVVDHVLAQRCDSLAGWWALLIEKERKKEKRRERKRKEREADVKSIRRLSAASSRLLAQTALDGIHEEMTLGRPSSPRGRRMTRTQSGANGSQSPRNMQFNGNAGRRKTSDSRSRPPPPPKDCTTTNRAVRGRSRGNSLLRYSTVNPDLLSPTYVSVPQRKRKTFYQQPLREHLAWVKHWFKDSTKRARSPHEKSDRTSPQRSAPNTSDGLVSDPSRPVSGPMPQHRKAMVGHRLEMTPRSTVTARPRLNTMSSAGSQGSVRVKRSSLSPALTPHSSYRGPRGRKSTSSSVSSVRSTFQGHHHSQSKASSTSGASVASPSGMSSASGSRIQRSPHSTIKVLPSTPTSATLPSGIRINRRPLPSGIGTLSGFTEMHSVSGPLVDPMSPGLPVFARRKRSVFKGPMGGSPAGFGRTPMGMSRRSISIRKRSGNAGETGMTGITEDDEDEDEEEVEEPEQEQEPFGPELVPASASPPASPEFVDCEERPAVPLTAEALAKIEAQN